MSAQQAGASQRSFTIPFLIIAACFLIGRLAYLYLGDPVRFPINTIKIIANYKHISHQDLESILSRYRDKSFFTLPVPQLFDALNKLPWAAQVDIERQWPDALKITLKEKQAIATWNGKILTDLGDTIQEPAQQSEVSKLPHLFGPSQNTSEVLDTYQKMSTILTAHHLKIDTLVQRENHAWEAVLANGITLKLGKQFPIERTAQFAQAYPHLTERPEPLLSVDLRYPKGMAVKWQSPANP